MLVKLTSMDQLVLPKSASSLFRGVDHFVVSEEDGCIVLTPVRESALDAVRSELAERSITEDDVKDAVAWARGRSRKTG